LKPQLLKKNQQHARTQNFRQRISRLNTVASNRTMQVALKLVKKKIIATLTRMTLHVVKDRTRRITATLIPMILIAVKDLIQQITVTRILTIQTVAKVLTQLNTVRLIPTIQIATNLFLQGEAFIKASPHNASLVKRKTTVLSASALALIKHALNPGDSVFH